MRTAAQGMAVLSAVKTAFWLIALSLVVLWWSLYAARDSIVVVYFGRPIDVANYVASDWGNLLYASLLCFVTAIASLLLAGSIAVALLVWGMRSDKRLAKIERVVAFFQTIPTLVIVTLALLIEREIVKALQIDAPIDLFCVIPVALSLVFSPLVYGIMGVNRAPMVMKAMLRIWNASPWWRIWRVYLPYITSEILTGMRASATWAVGAVLIAEGLMNGVSGDSRTLGHALIRPFSGNLPGETPAVILVSVVLGFSVYYVSKVSQTGFERWLYGTAWFHQQRYPI